MRAHLLRLWKGMGLVVVATTLALLGSGAPASAASAHHYLVTTDPGSPKGGSLNVDTTWSSGCNYVTFNYTLADDKPTDSRGVTFWIHYQPCSGSARWEFVDGFMSTSYGSHTGTKKVVATWAHRMICLWPYPNGSQSDWNDRMYCSPET